MIRLGVIGIGKIAQFHLNALSKVNDIKLTAFCNRTISKAEIAAKEFGVTRIYSDYKKMLSEAELDALCIFVSSNQLKTVLLDCLNYNIPILVEKPLGMNLSESQEIVNACKKKNSKVYVGLNRRFMSTVIQAKKLMEKSGGIKSIMIEANERLWQIKELYPGQDEIINNWIYLNGIHCIDLFRFFCNDVKTVNSKSSFGNYHSMIEFENGSMGHYSSVWDAPDGWSIQLLNEKVKLILKPLEKLIIKRLKQEDQIIELSDIDKELKPGFYLQAKAFSKAILGAKTLPDFNEAHKTMQLINQINGENK